MWSHNTMYRKRFFKDVHVKLCKVYFLLFPDVAGESQCQLGTYTMNVSRYLSHHTMILFHPFPQESGWMEDESGTYQIPSCFFSSTRNERKTCANLQFSPCILAKWQIWHFKHIRLINQSYNMLGTCCKKCNLYKRVMYVMHCHVLPISFQTNGDRCLTWHDESCCHFQTSPNFAILRLLYQLLGGLGHSLS